MQYQRLCLADVVCRAGLEGKLKLSQNRSAADRAGVIAQLEATGRDEDAALARLMAQAAPRS